MWPFGTDRKVNEEPTPTPERPTTSLSLHNYEDNSKDLPLNREEYVSSGVLFGLGALSSLVVLGVHSRYFKRLQNADWATPHIFQSKRWLRGVVTSVGDADNFRFYHTPGFGWSWPFKLRRIPKTSKSLKNQTIHIRIAGVDAPEAAHFGRPGQPFAAESLAWLRNSILGKTLHCKPIRRDQYGRIVAVVTTPTLLGRGPKGKSLALAMLRAGWGTTYEQSGADYGSWGLETFKCEEANAKSARRGMWVDGPDIETPAEYKRRTSAEKQGKAEVTLEDSVEKGGMFAWTKRKA